jgi:cyclopropane-fatty-acyl-phospholipid synthase
MEVFEPWDFSVCDVEEPAPALCQDAGTLADSNVPLATSSAMFDEKFMRTWRLYLAGSLAAFRVGTMQLFQITFAGPECRRIPWTRAHLYAPR